MVESKKFPLISDNLSIDIVNTEIVRRGERQDLLVEEEDLLNWLDDMKVNLFLNKEDYEKIESQIRSILSRLLEMRAILRNNFELIADGQPIQEKFITLLEKKIENAPFIYKLVNNKLIPKPVGKIEDVLESYIAYDALSLIHHNKLSYLKHCSNPECVLLFIDETGRRKWCSMKICGNRNKVAQFQSRKKS
ncbi:MULTISPECIES: CGNR zinc finger domain-containing protein [Paraliobacillus]|uniref:CGNR zinc finger domain-containing protein n=1 Tax=Paraliobacillus TaxID=200903 RepID=UPI000DD43993|nr:MULTISPECIES: CGNR zinc finger domain-containing protein [Paraliobacillus]